MDDRGLAGVNIAAASRILSRLTGLAWHYPVRCVLAIVAALGASILTLIMPYLLGTAVDETYRLLVDQPIHPAEIKARLYGTGGLLVAAAAGRGALTGYQGYLGEYVAHRVGFDLRVAFFEKLQRLSFTFHDAVHSGELITRGMLDLDGVRAYLESGVLRAIVVLLLVAVGSWQVLRADAICGALALSFVPFVIWRAAKMGYLLRSSWVRLQQAMSILTRIMEENLQGVRVVRAFASNSFELERFDETAAGALALANRRVSQRAVNTMSMNFAYFTAMGLLLLVGGHRVMSGAISIGTLTEVLTFMTVLQQPLRQIGMIVNSGARATSAGGRLFEVLDKEPDIRDAPGATALVMNPGVLRFENVGFVYPTAAHDRRSLVDISFEVRPGQTFGIVGPPGSGKSTIAQLIPRFYDVVDGRITIDGQDIRKLTLSSLRRVVGLIQQEVFLFDASVHDNVAYAEPDTGLEQVREATVTAQIHDHLDTLVQGFATRVGERGVSLSGGQRQRLSIARGLVARPGIMILDDSTAAIDANTEALLRTALQNTLKDMVTIIIAHRLSSVKDADEIIVLNEGRIVERGTHDVLRAAGGTYAALWRLQNRNAAPDVAADPSVA